MIRIISGKHRGRSLEILESGNVRPTSSRAREAIFNMLTHFAHGDKTDVVANAKVLDLFCGSGAMAFEALSRGALEATLVDINAQVLKVAEKNAKKLGETPNVKLIKGDATSLRKTVTQHNLVFLDPPYGKVNIAQCLSHLVEGGWIASGAIVVVELPKLGELSLPEEFKILSDRTYGIARVVLCELQSR